MPVVTFFTPLPPGVGRAAAQALVGQPVKYSGEVRGRVLVAAGLAPDDLPRCAEVQADVDDQLARIIQKAPTPVHGLDALTVGEQTWPTL